MSRTRRWFRGLALFLSASVLAAAISGIVGGDLVPSVIGLCAALLVYFIVWRAAWARHRHEEKERQRREWEGCR